jgi:hypothetical protein
MKVMLEKNVINLLCKQKPLAKILRIILGTQKAKGPNVLYSPSQRCVGWHGSASTIQLCFV